MEASRINDKSHHFGWLFFLLLLAMIPGRSMAQEYDVNAVKDAFEGFKKAIYGNQGRNAAALVDQRTIVYYERAFEEATTLDSVQLTARPLFERLQVLNIRDKGLKDGTSGMRSKPFFVYAVDSQLTYLKGLSLGLITLGEINFYKDSASARLLLDKTPVPYAVIKFHYEANSWRTDLTSLFAVFNRQNAGPKDVENDYLLLLLGHPPRAVWKPLIVQ